MTTQIKKQYKIFKCYLINAVLLTFLIP